MKLISLIFSFKNEEKNLDELVKRVHNTISKLNNYDYELIFVNDASDDNSEKILNNLQKTFPITIINMSRTFGVGPCVLAGFKHAQGDCIIYMDSDLQDPHRANRKTYYRIRKRIRYCSYNKDREIR